MLKCQNLSQVRIENALYLSIHSAAEFVIKRLWGDALVLSSDSAQLSTSQIDRKVLMRWSDGREFLIGFHLPLVDSPLSIRQFASIPRALQSIELVRKLSLSLDQADSEFGSGILIESPTRPLSNSHWFKLGQVGLQWSGRLLLKENSGLPFSLPLKPESHRSMTQRKFRLKALVAPEGLITEGAEIKIERLWIERRTVCFELSALIERTQSRLSLTIIGDPVMNQESREALALSIRLDLGEVEIPVEDVLELQVGSKIELERPQVFQAGLCIEGQKFAEALLELGEERATLKVVRIKEFV